MRVERLFLFLCGLTLLAPLKVLAEQLPQKKKLAATSAASTANIGPSTTLDTGKVKTMNVQSGLGKKITTGGLDTALAQDQNQQSPSVVVKQVPGTGNCAFSNSGGIDFLYFDSENNLYFVERDWQGNKSTRVLVHKLSSNGAIATVAGSKTASSLGDNGPATAALLGPARGLAKDPSGNLFIAGIYGALGEQEKIRKVNLSGTITTPIWQPLTKCLNNLGCPYLKITQLGAIDFDSLGNLYIAKGNAWVSPGGYKTGIMKLYPPQVIDGTADGDIIGSLDASNCFIRDIKVDTQGNIYAACLEHKVLKISPNGAIATVAGTGIEGYSGDNGPATQAKIGQVKSIALDSSGNLYISDATNKRIHKVNSSGIITSFIGTGEKGSPVENQPIAETKIDAPHIAISSYGFLHFANYFSCQIWRVANVSESSAQTPPSAGPTTSTQGKTLVSPFPPIEPLPCLSIDPLRPGPCPPLDPPRQ